MVITANVEGRDLGSFVTELQSTLSKQELPSGYWIDYGGQFQNLMSAKARMQLVVPLALLTIFILLMAVFHNIKESLLVFSGVPFALCGAHRTLDGDLRCSSMQGLRAVKPVHPVFTHRDHNMFDLTI